MAYITIKDHETIIIDYIRLYRDVCKVPDKVPLGWYRKNEKEKITSKLSTFFGNCFTRIHILRGGAMGSKIESNLIQTAKRLLKDGEITEYDPNEKCDPDPLNKTQRKW